MAEMEFFPQRPDAHPTVYAYEFVGVASHQGYIKVGYTERDVDTRIKEQVHTAAVPYRLLAYWSAMKNDGSCFTDHDVHAVLKRKGQFLNAKIPQELFDRVCKYSEQTRIPKTAIMEMALQEYMDRMSPVKKTAKLTKK